VIALTSFLDKLANGFQVEAVQVADQFLELAVLLLCIVTRCEPYIYPLLPLQLQRAFE
jgi:hypothetical protein